MVHRAISLALSLLQTVIACQVVALRESDTGSGRSSVLRQLIIDGDESYRRSQFWEATKKFENALTAARSFADFRAEAECLDGLGRVALILDTYASAQDTLKRAIAAASEANDNGLRSIIFCHFADAALARAMIPRARAIYRRALALGFESGNVEAAASAMHGIGRACLRRGDSRAALVLLGRAARRFRTAHGALGEAECDQSLGVAWRTLGDNSQAKRFLTQSLETAIRVDSRRVQVLALQSLGTLYLRIGESREAQEHFERALALARDIHDAQLEGTVSASLGNLFLKLDDGARARPCLENAIAIAHSKGDSWSEAASTAFLGTAFVLLGDQVSAVRHLEASHSLAVRIGDRKTDQLACGNLGIAYLRQGAYEPATAVLRTAAGLNLELGDLDGYLNSIDTIGVVALAKRDYSRAARLIGFSYDHARARGDIATQTRCLGNLGILSHDIGDESTARKDLKGQLALALETGDRRNEARALANLANVFRADGGLPKARRCLERARDGFRKVADRSGEFDAIGSLGNVLRQLGDYDHAQSCIEARLDYARSQRDLEGEATALDNLGAVMFDLERIDDAERLARASLAAFDVLGDDFDRLHPLMTLAKMALRRGDIDSCVTILRQARRVLESSAASSLGSGAESSWRARWATWAEIVQDATAGRLESPTAERAARDSAISEGLSDASLWKARSLMTGVIEHQRAGRNHAATLLIQRLRDIHASREKTLGQIASAIRDGKDCGSVDELKRQVSALRDQAEACERQLRQEYPRDYRDYMPLEVLPADVGHVLSARTALIEFTEGEERLYAYSLSRGRLEFVALGEKEGLYSDAALYVAAISKSSVGTSDAGIVRLGQQLFESVLAPVLERMPAEVDRLVIIPVGNFASLPFEALVARMNKSDGIIRFEDAEFLIDRYEVVYAPSTSFIAEIRAAKPLPFAHKALVLADPLYEAERPKQNAGAAAVRRSDGHFDFERMGSLERLEHSRQEAYGLASVLTADSGPMPTQIDALMHERSGSFSSAHCDIFLGADATRRQLTGELQKYSIIHIAAHGFVDSEVPRRSGLALSADPTDAGYFSTLDALDLDLDCEAVVLSACRSARGTIRAGEGVESLASAFLSAGSRSVVASLWNVADEETGITMENFYRGWLHDGLSPEQALHRAKLALRHGKARDGKFRWHPYYWAPFVYIGATH